MKKPEITFEPKLIGDLLDIIYNATIIIDSDQRIIFANSRTADMFQAKQDELPKMYFHELFAGEDKRILAPNIITLTRKNSEYEGESLFRRLDGSTFLGLIAGTYFSWDSNKEGMAFTINDISTMKALEKSLRKSERIAFLGRLVNDISHQIRNPVMVMGGFARRLHRENDNKKHTQAIMTEASRLETLLDTLHHFISLPAPEPKKIKLAALIDSIETQLRAKVADLGCSWASDFEPLLGEESLLIDQALLLQALEAVVKNGCESYQDAGREKTIRFSLKHSSNSDLPFILQISDRGCGVKQESLNKLFSHFYTEKTHHIGMGLTFAQRIVEEQKGMIHLESSFGYGTTVSIFLPKERRREIRTKLLGEE